MVIAFSIAALLPVFARYITLTWARSLPVILLTLMFGFGFVAWGMFMKNRKVLALANIIGGFLVILLSYSQLWSLGQGARIIAAAAGLLIAVVVSVVKFKEKLT